MAIILRSLTVTGPGKPEAQIEFRYPATLVRGPSDTGKSYIRDCLWALLGGEKNPKKIPQAEAYDTMSLRLDVEGIDSTVQMYEVKRAIAGGESAVSRLLENADLSVKEDSDDDVGEFLVEKAGASGKQLLRSRSKKGGVTGGDLRHWFLLSQPAMISESPTFGDRTNAVQRIAAFHLFISGTDDAAIELAKTGAEKYTLTGKLLGLEESLRRVKAELPHDKNREEITEALERVDEALSSVTIQYNQRLSNLKSLREDIYQSAGDIKKLRYELDRSRAMVDRFELLEKKYQSDSERLGATWEGISMFQAMDEVPCPLCGTPAESQLDPRHLEHKNQDGYRKALRAELDKISALRSGLIGALDEEKSRVEAASTLLAEKESIFGLLEKKERRLSESTSLELGSDPKKLALRRSELSEWLSRFDEETRIQAEIDQLTKSKAGKAAPLNRNVGEASKKISSLAKEYLHSWGFGNVDTVVLDTEACDLIINGRARLDFGAGKRSIFLAALVIAMMTHSLNEGHPHLGFVLIDSPLKAYADPKNQEGREVPVLTVTDRFYQWLSKWEGPGQLIILENQEIRAELKSSLSPIEFIGDAIGEGRRGFYP